MAVSHNTLSILQDPLNSGDDVIEQDIPDLFDTDNVIVCQYDKVRTFSFSAVHYLLLDKTQS